jgi:uncharacterized membrane protein YoaK (UPF0700 family)
VGNIRTAKSGVHETGNDPNTLRARDSGRATNLEKRDANTALHTRRAKPSAQMNLLDRLAGAIGSLVATRPVHFIALLGLCAAYIQGGLDKLFDFNAAIAETQSFGLPFAAAATAATIVTELAGSALILTGIYRWLGALWLASRCSPPSSQIDFGKCSHRNASWSRTRSSSTSDSPAAFCSSRGSIYARAMALRSETRMQSANSIVDVVTLTQDARHGPLPLLLIVLTVVTGLVDAVSYLKLGHVFVANMTGNVLFLGFAAADVTQFSVAVSLVAIGSFLLGALAAGRLGSSTGQHRGRFLALATYAQVSVVGAAFVVSLASSDVSGGILAYALVVLLAFAMGLQNAAARRLGVPDLTTTVLTQTVTGLAADSHFAGGANPNIGRRLLAIVAMFIGASLGAVLTLHVSASAALAVAVALLLINAMAGYRLSSSTAAWTAAK